MRRVPFQFEAQQNMNRFQGARGISSADYFGESQPTRAGGGPMMQVCGERGAVLWYRLWGQLVADP